MPAANQHGGKRPGSGRKPSAGQPRNITRSVKLTKDEAAYISEVGTGELWRLLQASRKFREWRKKRATIGPQKGPASVGRVQAQVNATRREYQPPITTLAEVRSLWRYLGAASQCNLLREFDVEPARADIDRLTQVVHLWRELEHSGDPSDGRKRICQFVEEVADTVRGNV